MTVSDAFSIALAALASIGSGGAIVFGLSSWLGKVWANRILEADRKKYSEELERLRSQLETAVHAHRLQFETEFKAMEDIWAKVSAVRSTIGQVRPIGDIVDPNETPEARLARRFEAFTAAFNALVTAVDQRSPFYTEAIYGELSAAIQIARSEHTDVSLHQRNEPEWYRNGAANTRAFVARADTISRLIRERLASLRVA